MRNRIIAAAAGVALTFGGLAMTAPAAHATEHECEDGNFIPGTPFADVLNGTNCDDNIFGFAGPDRIRGRYGFDNLFGNRGADVISDPSSEGNIYGGSGWDTCIVEADSNINLYSCENIVLV